MKNKERIEQLEKQVQALTNRVSMLELRKMPPSTPAAPAPMPTTWPSYPKLVPGEFYPNSVPYITCASKACTLH